MVKRLTAIFRCLHKDLKVLHDLLLSGEIAEFERAESVLKVLFRALLPLASYVRIFIHSLFYYCFSGIKECGSATQNVCFFAIPMAEARGYRKGCGSATFVCEKLYTWLAKVVNLLYLPQIY